MTVQKKTSCSYVMMSAIGQGFVTESGKVVARPFASFYAGDYDGSAWLYSQLKSKWDDPRRGQVRSHANASRLFDLRITRG